MVKTLFFSTAPVISLVKRGRAGRKNRELPSSPIRVSLCKGLSYKLVGKGLLGAW
jgi:hypothetical protein